MRGALPFVPTDSLGSPMSIPFLTSDTRKAAIVLPLFSQLKLTPHNLELQGKAGFSIPAALTPVPDRSRSTERAHEFSSSAEPEDCDSFYLSESGLSVHLNNNGERKYSESLTDLDSDAVRDQLCADTPMTTAKEVVQLHPCHSDDSQEKYQRQSQLISITAQQATLEPRLGTPISSCTSTQ